MLTVLLSTRHPEKGFLGSLSKDFAQLITLLSIIFQSGVKEAFLTFFVCQSRFNYISVSLLLIICSIFLNLWPRSTWSCFSQALTGRRASCLMLTPCSFQTLQKLLVPPFVRLNAETNAAKLKEKRERCEDVIMSEKGDRGMIRDRLKEV